MALIDEVLELEHAGWRSLCDGTASEFYGALMIPEGVMVLAHGQVFDRSTVVEALADAPPWSRYEISDERFIPLGSNSVAIVYTGRGIRDGSDDFVGLMTSVYTRVDGRWRLAVYQQTAVPGVE
jgi:hypothetical protein